MVCPNEAVIVALPKPTNERVPELFTDTTLVFDDDQETPVLDVVTVPTYADVTDNVNDGADCP